MLDIGWSEMAVIAMIALIVIGPRELPKVLRTVGRWAGKARRMAREFQNSVDEMVRESELDEVRKTVQSATVPDIGKEIENTIDPDGSLARDLDPTAPTTGTKTPSAPSTAEGEPAAETTAPPASAEGPREAAG